MDKVELFVATEGESQGSVWICREQDGLRMLTATKGESNLVFATSDTFSFCSTWSPDGRFVAVYTAPRRTDLAGSHSESSWENYEVFPSEPGFVPMAETIAIADREGRVVRTINVEGKALVDFRRSPDSSGFLFLTCTFHTQSGSYSYSVAATGSTRTVGSGFRCGRKKADRYGTRVRILR